MSSAQADSTNSLLLNALAGLLVAVTFTLSLVPLSLSFGSVSTDPNFADGSSFRQILLLLLFSTAIWVLYLQGPTALNRLRRLNPFLLLLIAYCAVSAVWSPFPVVTLKRTFVFAGLALIGLAISPPTASFEHFLRVMRWTLTIVCLLSALMALALPSIGVDYILGGAWRGITWQKNTLGSTASYAALLWFRQWMVHGGHRSSTLLALLFCLVVLVMAKSSTALLMTVLGLGTYILFHRQWFRGRYLGFIIALLALTALGLSLHFFYVSMGRMLEWRDVAAPIAALFGKGIDLTGRTDIWRYTLLAIQQHPILGIGYGAFWLGEGSPSQYIIDSLGWVLTHSHNGYLDAWNELGIAGCIILFATLVWYGITIVRLSYFAREASAIHSMFFVIFLTSNLSETSLLNSTAFPNILFIYCCVLAPFQLTITRRRSLTSSSSTSS
ncbi:O-antigen ligase family protein [Pusillimonas sp. CC-YST705]|uniref:O-antigen ligase family protein n=1 Tax=Mesopusillimonas faecipullorum TaxID=2755040 RepID=A0ABS8CEU9_9BURK|nr:O-antigen ligase family protein [Mesopusillimonas faecipullorum]MCB5364548.1 O-antigen ligase family protein [Mesopusillimonas faecipullorum]